jgi:hypothetical protein
VEWKRIWSANGRTEANLKTFLVDQYLPYWLQCNRCSKWREVLRDTDVTPELIRMFVCDTSLEVFPSKVLQSSCISVKRAYMFVLNTCACMQR